MSLIVKLISAFEQCTSLDVKVVQSAEQSLNELSSSKDFVSGLLEILESDQISTTIHQFVAIYFKNHIKRFYGMPCESGGISEEDCNLIKFKLIPIIISKWCNRPVHQQLITCFTLIISTDFPSDWPDLIKNLFATYILNDSCGIGTKRAAFQLVHFTLYKYREETSCNEVLSDLKFHVLPHISNPLLALLYNSTLSLMTTDPKESHYEHTFGLCLYTCQIIHSILSIDLPEFFEAALSSTFESFFKLLTFENSQLSAEDETKLETVELMKSEICQILTLFASRYNEEFEPYVTMAVNSVLNLLADARKLQSPCYDMLVINAINFLSAAARFLWSPSPFLETPDRLQQICEYIILPNLELRPTDIELIEQHPQEFIRRTLEDFEVDTRRNAANHLITALTASYNKEISSIIPSYITTLLANAGQTKNMMQREQIIDAVVYLVIGMSVQAESRAFGVARVSSTINLAEFLSQHLVPEITSASQTNILSRSAALKFLATFRNQLNKQTLLQLIPEIFKNLSIANPVVHTHAAHCIQSLLTAREITENNASTFPEASLKTYQLKFTVEELKSALLASIDPLFKQMQEETEITDNENLIKCLFRILVFLNENAVVLIIPTLEKLCEIVKIKFAAPANPIYNHYLWECVATCCKICALANLHSKMESIVLETLSIIISLTEHDFIPYALQILGVLLDTASTASIIYINLVTNILKLEQWTISTARVSGIIRVLSAFLRKHHLFESHIKTMLPTMLQLFEYCLNHKKLVQVALEFLSDILHYVSLEEISLYAQPIVIILLKRLKASRNQKLCQQVSLNMAIIDCRSPFPVIPKTLNSIQFNLCSNFCLNIYVPSFQKLTAIYDKKLGLLTLAKMITSDEVLENTELVQKILEVAAILMGAATVQEQTSERSHVEVHPKHFQDILLDNTNLGKPEEFQGNFSALQAAKISVQAKELDEVKLPMLLTSLKECFNQPKVLDKISKEPLWINTILPFLANQQ